MLLAEKKVVEALAAAGVEKPSSSSAAPASSSVTTTKSLSVVDSEAFDLMRQRVLELEIICSRQAATINALQTVVHAPPKQQVQVIALAASTDTNTEANTEANNEANTEAPPPHLSPIRTLNLNSNPTSTSSLVLKTSRATPTKPTSLATTTTTTATTATLIATTQTPPSNLSRTTSSSTRTWSRQRSTPSSWRPAMELGTLKRRSFTKEG